MTDLELHPLHLVRPRQQQRGAAVHKELRKVGGGFRQVGVP